MGSEMLLLLLFATLLIGVFLGFPVAFVMLGTGLMVGIIGQGSSFFHTMLFRVYGVMEHYELVAIPLFVFMGSCSKNRAWPNGFFQPFITPWADCGAGWP